MKLVVAICALADAVAFGAVMPQLPESQFAGTEVWTNVPCERLLSDVREFEVALDFTGTASNCVQVAFGRDADGDGDLSRRETGFIAGWAAGKYFIEDAANADRVTEAGASTNSARRLSLKVAVDAAFRVRSAAAVGDGVARFASVLGAAPRWLYGRDWNMAKVTRRGVDAPGEIVVVVSDHGGLKFIVR